MSPEVYGFLKVGNVVARSAFDNEVTSNFLIFTKLSGDCFGTTSLAMTYARFVNLL